MTEKRILELLGNSTFRANDYSRLLPEHVKPISKSITNIIYDTLKDKTSSCACFDLIKLLRKWCIKDTKHFSINDLNYNCFLNCITSENSTKDSLDDFLHKELPSLSFHSDIIAEMTDFFEQSDRKRLQKRTRIENIFDADQANLRDIEYVVTKNFLCIESFDEFLCRFSSTLEKNPEINIQPDVSKNLKRVRFVYALLNFPDRNTSLLREVLGDIAHKETRMHEEIELIEYIWRREGIHEDLKLELLRKFPFLYEIPLLELCTKLLNSDDSQERVSIIAKYEVEESRLIKLCSSNDWLKTEIRLLLYDLFRLSKFDENILNPINLF